MIFNARIAFAKLCMECVEVFSYDSYDLWKINVLLLFPRYVLDIALELKCKCIKSNTKL